MTDYVKYFSNGLSESKIVRIVDAKEQSILSKAQKLFNKLIKKIDRERKLLASWQDTIPLCQQKYTSEFVPLLQTFNNLKGDLVSLLDNVYADKTFSKTDKATIDKIICSIAEELIIEEDREDLKQIYNKYSQSDFDAEIEEEKEAMKSIMGEVLGVDLEDDIDFSSPEEMMAYISEKVQQQEDQKEHTQQKYQARRKRHKKSAKALAREAKKQEEEKNVSQSLREVYLKLARELHPDREQDAQERERKTALMRRVNVAYSNKDLLGLLELQLEAEQIDEATLQTMSEERFHHYNKVLTEQSLNLQNELFEVELSFRMRFNVLQERALTPQAALHFLQHDMRCLQQDIDGIKNDLRLFQNIKNIKKWLKFYRIPQELLFKEAAFG